MARTAWIAIGLLSLLGAKPVHAEIREKGNTAYFTGGQFDMYTAHLKKISRFHQELSIDSVDVDGSVPGIYPLLAKLKRRVVQGVQFELPPTGAFAVVMSYFCSIMEPGAEQPFVCQSMTVSVDSMGKVLSQVQGNHFEIEVHDYLPYYILMQDSCCDSAVQSALYRISGEKICEIPDHRDETWAKRNTIKCRKSADGSRMRVDLVEE